MTCSTVSISTFPDPLTPATLSSKSRMRTSAILTLFFSFFFAGVAFCLPLSLPASAYAPGTRSEQIFFTSLGSWLTFTSHLEDTLGSRIMDPAIGSIELFIKRLGESGLRGIQLQVRDYCSRFPCQAG